MRLARPGDQGVPVQVDKHTNKKTGKASDLPQSSFVFSKEGEGADVVSFLEDTLDAAIGAQCSDIHIEGQEGGLRIRFRKDGRLFTYKSLDKSLHQALVARVKILSQLDIAEKRRAQDGRFSYTYGGREIDVRVSILPTVEGEKLALRLLNAVKLSYTPQGIGIQERDLDLVRLLLRQPSGLILLCGPTGCGKTSTLYTMIQMVNDETRNVVTIEDPVEYKIPGVNQIPVNAKTGLGFESGLKAILRQDPEIIMVGEIRSYETAEIALRASITGHLVLSTLHSVDSPSALVRLRDMRVAPYMISSGLVGIISQRLVRLLCPSCKEAYQGRDDYFGLREETLYKARGCKDCTEGYQGRQAIFEILVMDEALRSMVMEGAPLKALREAAAGSGMVTLYSQVKDLLMEGKIDLDQAYQTIATL